jgi:ribosome-associated protein
LTSRQLALKIAQFALSKKASDVVLLDLRPMGSIADFFVLCSADSDTQVKAIADSVREGTDTIGARLWHSEGFRALSWVLLDYVDVVVHVFHKEARSFYRIEKLWSEAARFSVEDSAEIPVKSAGGAARATSTRKSRVTPIRKGRAKK